MSFNYTMIKCDVCNEFSHFNPGKYEEIKCSNKECALNKPKKVKRRTKVKEKANEEQSKD